MPSQMTADDKENRIYRKYHLLFIEQKLLLLSGISSACFILLREINLLDN